MAEERLQKLLAQAGVASRRRAEELITAGRVRVEGVVVTELGTKADSRAKIEVDGKLIQRQRLCYGILHKPRGMLTTMHDPEGRATAGDLLREVGVRVVPVGRLDYNTSGALLFTNDGDFAHGLSHASGRVPKVYSAKVQERLDEAALEKWSRSIEIDGKMTKPANVRILRREGDKTWVEVTINEGRNRQVRRLGEQAHTPVVRLSRLSHAGISTDGLRPGQWRLLSIDELKTLKTKYGVPEKIRGILEVAPGRSGSGRSGPARSPRGGNKKPAGRGAADGRGYQSRDGEQRGTSERRGGPGDGRNTQGRGERPRGGSSPSGRGEGSSRRPRTRR